MAELTAISIEEARRVGRALGVEVESVEALGAGSVNSNHRVVGRDGRHWFFRVYEEQGPEGARGELRLLDELARAGVPAATAAVGPGGGVLAEHAGRPVAMYPWIDGEILCQARVEPRHCRAVGEMLARVHAATARVTPLGEGRFRVEDLRLRLDRAERQGTAEQAAAAREVRRRLEEHAPRRAPRLARGVIHGDLFRDNVIWQEGKIAAVVDFESASEGRFAYDLAVTVLAWCHGSRLDPDLAGALLEGYEGVRPLEEPEREAFSREAAIGALRFAATRITDFWMRAPPGERPKRDFRRFLDRLDAIERGELDAVIARPGGRG